MDPITLAGLLVQGGGAIGGLLGNLIGGQNAPSLETLLQLSQMKEGNAYDKIALDPQAMNAALRAMGRLQEVSDANGMDVQSRVAQQQAMQEANRNEQGQRMAILQNMAARGMGGSGQEYAAQLANQQGSAQGNWVAGSQAASDARQRAMQAAAMTGQLGLGIRGQQYDEASRRAQAANAISMFNASQRLGAAQQAGANAQQTTDRWSRVGAGAGQAAGAGAYAMWNPKKSSLLPDDKQKGMVG